MHIDPTLLVFGVVVASAYAVQTTIGMGATMLCVIIGAHLFPLHYVLALTVPLSVLQTSYITLRHHDGIDWRLLLGRILPLMGTGVVLGLWLGTDIDRPWLQTAFAVLVLTLALLELRARLRAGDGTSKALPPLVAHIAMFAAGIVHGLFATGGPLLVYAIGRRGLDKHVFRSTLSAVWLVMNVFLCAGYAHIGRIDHSTLATSALVFPAVPLGVLVGERLHHRVDERRFQIAVFVVLAIGAFTLLLR